MLVDALTKFEAVVSKTLLELLTSGSYTIEGSARLRDGYGMSKQKSDDPWALLDEREVYHLDKLEHHYFDFLSEMD